MTESDRPTANRLVQSPEDDAADRAIAFIVRHPFFEHLSQDHNGTAIICGRFAFVGPLNTAAITMAGLLRAYDAGAPSTPELDDEARRNPMWPDDEE